MYLNKYRSKSIDQNIDQSIDQKYKSYFFINLVFSLILKTHSKSMSKILCYSMNYDQTKFTLITNDLEYKKIILTFYQLDDTPGLDIESIFIKKENLTGLYNILYNNDLINNNNLEQYILLEENIVFNNKIYKLINMSKLIKFIKILYPDIKKHNTIIHLIYNTKNINIYPKIKHMHDNIINDIKKLKNELKELKNEFKELKNDIIDIKSIINYINTKMNNTLGRLDIKSKPINEILNKDLKIITYTLYFPNSTNFTN